MVQINIFEAKTKLSKLVEAVESGQEAEIIIARNGKPAARLVPLETKPKGKRIGVAEGKFVPPEPDPELDEIVAAMLRGER